MYSSILLSVYLSLMTVLLVYTCELSMKYGQNTDLNDKQPLILTENGQGFLYPDGDENTLTIPRGQSIQLACAGDMNTFQKFPGIKEVIITCIGNQTFNVNNVDLEFSDLKCKYKVQSKAKYTGTCFQGNVIEIGFELSNNYFLCMIEICRDDETYETHYSKFKLLKSIANAQRGVSRPKWKTYYFFERLKVDHYYKQDVQIKTFARILRENEASIRAKYIIPDEGNPDKQFISRGHLAANADFVYAPQQECSFWYLNAAPQWYTTNSGNWNRLEQSIREFVKKRKLDLDVYTGTYEIMQLPDSEKTLRQIYMKSDGCQSMRVPELFWKVIYDPVGKRGTAFLGLNNPFVKNISTYVFLCTDISSELQWLTWDPEDTTAGISYGCDVDDARRSIQTIPKLQLRGILL